MKRLLLIFACTVGAMAAPPNAVMIISDDHHWGDQPPFFGLMGHSQIQTPHLDRLARERLGS